MDTAKKGDILEKDKMENQETPQAMPSVEERLSKLEEMISQLVQANSVEKQEGEKPCEAGAESKPEEVTKEQGKPEENVVLPKTPEEEIQENKPAEGAKVDEVKVVEKEGANLADETVQDIKDIKKMLKTASTPRPASDTGLINKSVQYKMPTNWKEANALARKLAK